LHEVFIVKLCVFYCSNKVVDSHPTSNYCNLVTGPIDYVQLTSELASHLNISIYSWLLSHGNIQYSN